QRSPDRGVLTKGTQEPRASPRKVGRSDELCVQLPHLARNRRASRANSKAVVRSLGTPAATADTISGAAKGSKIPGKSRVPASLQRFVCRRAQRPTMIPANCSTKGEHYVQADQAKYRFRTWSLGRWIVFQQADPDTSGRRL